MSTLIKIKTKTLPSMGELHWLAAKHIFEKHNCSMADSAALEEGIVSWSKKIDLNPSDRWEITRIVNALIADENGHFNRVKELIKQHGVTYKTFYNAGLPFISDPSKCRTFGKM
jgi:hypothetical protein